MERKKYCSLIFTIFFLMFFVVMANCTKASPGHVLVLTGSNFEKTLNEYHVVFVEYVKLTCGHCKNFMPKAEKSAIDLAKTNLSAAIGKVVCSDSEQLCEGIRGFPFFKIYKDGHYLADRKLKKAGRTSSKEVTEFIIMESSVPSIVMKDEDHFNLLALSEEPFLAGFFASETSELFKLYLQQADQLRENVKFVHSFDKELNAKLGFYEDIVIVQPLMLRSDLEDPFQRYTGGINEQSLEFWISRNFRGLVGYLSLHNKDLYFPIPMVRFFFDCNYEQNPTGFAYWRYQLLQLAKTFKSGVEHHFVMSCKGDRGADVYNLGCPEPHDSSKPCVVVKQPFSKYVMPPGPFSMEAAKTFVRQAVRGEIEPTVNGEPVPLVQGKIKKVVAHNYDDIVNDLTKDVILYVYKPTCGYCVMFDSLFDKVARQLQDEPNIVFAKLNKLLNDFEVTPAFKRKSDDEGLSVTGVPMVMLASINNKENPLRIIINHNTTAADIVEFIAKHSTEPLLGFDRNGLPRKSEL